MFLLSISLISASAIAYEILLMRLFSMIQWHHFASMVISLALLGYGAGGTFLTFAAPRLKPRFGPAFTAFAAFMSVGMVGGFSIAQRIPFNALEILWTGRQAFYLVLIYLILSVPFFCASACIGLTFIRHPDRIHRIYRADLFGAGIGAAAIILILFVFRPEAGLPLIGMAPIAAAALAVGNPRPGFGRGPAVILILLAAASPFLWPDRWISLRISEYKGLSQALQVKGAVVIHEISSPLGLLTVVRNDTVPFRYAPGLSLQNTSELPSQLGVFTDADAMTVITRNDGDRGKLSYLDQMAMALPYHLLERPRVLVLGAGGGADVLQARYQGASAVEAVELNPQMAHLVKNRYADFAGHLYDTENVKIRIADARAFVAGSRERYDLIQLSLIDSFAATAAGMHALSESYLYTVEALEDYLSHLEPEGFLMITRWLKLPPSDGLKLFATALQALERSGLSESGRRLILFRSWNTVSLLIKNGPWTEAELAVVKDFCRRRSFDLDYYPGIRAEEINRYNVLEPSDLYEGSRTMLGPDRDDFIQRYKFYIRPATDDRPYFFDFFKWRALWELLSLRDRGGLPLLELGYPILVITLLQAALISVLLILLPLWKLPMAGEVQQDRIRIGLYFFSLGLSFLFIEIAFIQKFILFLSHPLYAVAVVLSAFLVFAGLGSGYSNRWLKRFQGTGRSAVRWVVIGIMVIAGAEILVLPWIIHALMPMPDTIKIVVSLILIAPLAFCMGMPFPLGLAWVSKKMPDFIPWAWAINGCASVLSAVLATLLAIHFGFIAVVFAAVLLYLLAAGLIQDSHLVDRT